MSQQDAFTLLLFVAGAFIMPNISRALRIPGSVGEILYGILIGCFFASSLADGDAISFLASFGLSCSCTWQVWKLTLRR